MCRLFAIWTLLNLDSDVAFMHDFLSTPRKQSFEQFFRTQNKNDFQGVYRWHQSVSSSFLAVMNDFEITLRNTIHFSLSNFYDTANNNCFDWMGLTVIQSGHSPNHIPHRLNGQRQQNNQGATRYTGSLGKIQDGIQTLTNKGKPITPDAVVAEMTFAFWPNVIQQLSHPSHDQRRGTILSAMLPHAPSHDTALITTLNKLLKQIRLLRNRLGHHDSLLKFKEVDTQGNAGFIPQKPRHTITSMKLMIQHMQMILNWIDHGLSSRLQQSDHWHRLDMLLSLDVLGYYRFDYGISGCYVRAINYISSIEKGKCYQAKKKYRRAKFPKEKQIIEAYPH